jgi:hypothetical protein
LIPTLFIFMKRLVWLEDQLDRDDLPQHLRDKYELEAAREAEFMAKQQEKAKLAKQEKAARDAELKAKLIAGDVNIIDTHGIPEFGDDYEILKEGERHVVYSRVAREDQESRWMFLDDESANSKYRKLIWDRLYSKYVRVGEVDHLSELVDG